MLLNWQLLQSLVVLKIVQSIFLIMIIVECCWIGRYEPRQLRHGKKEDYCFIQWAKLSKTPGRKKKRHRLNIYILLLLNEFVRHESVVRCWFC